MSSTAMPSAVVLPAAPERSKGYWSGVFRRVRRDPVTLVCGGILLLMLAAILLAPWIAPHDPYQTSMIRRLKPIGFQDWRYALGTD